ncbi:MAG: carbohydrate ABC transporter permease [Bilifractor sp.]
MTDREYEEEKAMAEINAAVRKHPFSRYGKSDKAFIIISRLFLAIFVIAIIVPMIYIVIASFMDPVTLQNQGITFNFKKWTVTAYQRVLTNKQIWIGFLNAVIYSVAFTVISVAVTMLAAYPMSRKDLKGRGFFNVIFVITMFFGGGLIPTYLVISDLGLLDTIWAVILPGAFSVWNMIIARTYYQGIPKELREAAAVDGANEVQYFFRILLPVCKPLIAVLVLWQFVAMWNSYFDAMIYINTASKQPLQLVLRAILIQNQPQSGMIADIQSTAARAQLGELLKYATIIISSLPLIVMYPFFQKYFDAGIMVGSVKG